MAFSDDIVQKVWEKGRADQDRDADTWRKDECGAWLRREHYDNPVSEFGWKIVNVSAGGADDLENLRPFHRSNEYDRANERPHCHTTSDRQGVPPTAQVGKPGNRGL